MPKEIYLIRHAQQQKRSGTDVWNIDASLTREAVKQIKTAAQRFQDKGIQFSYFAHSHLIRAAQTCNRLHEAMKSKASSGHFEGLGPGFVSEWNSLYREWREKQDPKNVPELSGVDFANLWPDLAKKEGQRVLSAVLEIADEIKNNECAAAISHNPLIRLAQQAAIGGELFADLTYCQAVKFTVSRGRVIACGLVPS
jgi:broad specificity phosphatase PhoE